MRSRCRPLQFLGLLSWTMICGKRSPSTGLLLVAVYTPIAGWRETWASSYLSQWGIKAPVSTYCLTTPLLGRDLPQLRASPFFLYLPTLSIVLPFGLKYTLSQDKFDVFASSFREHCLEGAFLLPQPLLHFFTAPSHRTRCASLLVREPPCLRGSGKSKINKKKSVPFCL